MSRKNNLGGVVHTYQKYDPGNSRTRPRPQPDLVSPAFEHAADVWPVPRADGRGIVPAIELDPSQIANLGPSIDFLRGLLEDRKRKILEKYETQSVVKKADKVYHKSAQRAEPPKPLRGIFKRATEEQQIYLLERLYYQVGDDTDRFAGQLVPSHRALGK
ncbi:MAG: hypothetical protein R3C56_05290 [Pirellulaceae bacterium]